MNKSEEELLVDQLINTYNELLLTASVIESAEKHLGPSNWDFEGVAERANKAVEEIGESDLEGMREHLKNMLADLKSALGPLSAYQKDERSSKATMMLRFMLNGRINRINQILE